MEAVEQLVVDAEDALDVPLLASLEEVLTDLPPSDAPFAAALLLSSAAPPSLLAALARPRAADRADANCRVRGLKLVADFVKRRLGASAVQHASAAVAQAVQLFRADASNEVRAAALALVRNLLRLGYNKLAPLTAEAVGASELLGLVLESLTFGKQTKGTRSELLKVLGLLVGCFPHAASPAQVEAAFRQCRATLVDNFKGAKEPDYPAMAGALSCVDRLLFHFEDGLADPAELLRHLLTALSVVHAEGARLGIASKALRLLRNHASLPALAAQLGANARQSYEALLAVRASGKAATNKHVGVAVSSVLSALAPRPECRPFLRATVQQLCRTLDGGDVREKEALFAARCVADAGAALAGEDGADVIAAVLGAANRAEADGRTAPASRLLFLFAAAKLALSAGLASAEVIRFFEARLPPLLLAAPTLPPRTHATLAQTLCLLLGALARDQHSLAAFLDDLVPGLLLRTSSRLDASEEPPFASLTDPLTGLPDQRLFVYYAPLWAELLAPASEQTRAQLFAARVDPEEYAQLVAGPLLDALVRALLELVDGADLDYSRAEDASLVPSSVVDQEMLVNAAAFFERVLPALPSRVPRWLPLVAERLAARARRLPVVSGLYRLLGSFLRTSLRQGSPVPEPLVGLVRFLNLHIRAFEGELLGCCAGLVFALDAHVALEELLPALELSLRTGVRLLEAVEVLGRRALALAPHLPALLPLLAPYLLEEAASGRDRAIHSSLAARQRLAKEGAPDQAALVSHAVVRLLGRLGGRNKLLQLRPQQVLASKQGAPLADSPLDFRLAMPTTSKHDVAGIAMSVTDLLPRLIQLSSGASADQQTQALSAELLHGLVVYAIGSAASQMSRGNALAPLFRLVLPAAARLSVSENPLTCQLFLALHLQVVRWFSGPTHAHEDDVAALLDSLLALACDDADGRVRAAAARGVEEFFVWSVRQRPTGRLASKLDLAGALVDRVLALSGHSGEGKRAAASLLLGRVCVHVREDGLVAHRLLLRIVLELLRSLRLPQSAADGELCVGTIGAYVGVVVKSVQRMGDRFKLLVPSAERGDPACVADLVHAVWARMGSRACSLVRGASLSVCAQLIPLLFPRDEPSPILRFVRARELSAADFEDRLLEKRAPDAGEELDDWVLALTSSLDCYCWLLDVSTDLASLLLPQADASSKKRKSRASPHACSRVLEGVAELCALALRGEGPVCGSALYADFLRLVVHLLSHLARAHAESAALVYASARFGELLVRALLPSPSPADCKIHGDAILKLSSCDLLRKLDALDHGATLSALGSALTRALASAAGLIECESTVERCATLLSVLEANAAVEHVFGAGALRDSGRRLVAQLADLAEDADDGAVRRCAAVLGLAVRHCGVTLADVFLLLKGADRVWLFLRRFGELPGLLLQDFALARSLVDLSSIALGYAQPDVATDAFLDALLTAFLELPNADTRRAFLLNVSPAALFCRRFIGKLASLSSSVVPAVDALDDFLRAEVAAVLSSREASADAVVDALGLVAHLVHGTTAGSPRGGPSRAPREESELSEALEEMVALRYPLNSMQLDPTSSSGKDFGVVLSAHLELIAATGCVALFDQLTPLLREGAKHRYYSRLCSAFTSVALSAAEAGLKDLLAHSAIAFSKKCSSELRDFYFANLLAPVFRHCPQSSLEAIACRSDVALTGLSGSVIKQLVETAQKSSDKASQAAAYSLCGILYDRLSIGVLRGAVTQAYVGSSSVAAGKELTLALTIACTAEVSRAVLDSSALDLALRSSALNCLLLVVCKTQSSEKFYDAIFSKTVWAGVVDCTITYSFEDSKFATVTLGDETSEGSQPATSPYRRAGMRSSLSQGSFLSLSSFVSQTQDSRDEPADTLPIAQEVKGLDDFAIGMELNHLNRQPCMGHLLRAVQRMGVLFAEGWAASMEPPGVALTIKRMLVDSTQHRNVRLFFLRLLLNRPTCDLMRPFAAGLFEAVLHCTTTDLCEEGTLNYFIKDVIFLVCHAWAAEPLPAACFAPASALLSRVLSMLSQRGDESGGYKENALCAVSLLHVLLAGDKGGRLDVSLDPALALATSEYAFTGGAYGKAGSKGAESVRRRMAGLLVLCAALESAHPLVLALPDAVKDALFDSVKYPRKEVYVLASRGIGAYLSSLRASGTAAAQSKGASITETLESILLSKMSKKDGFDQTASCLCAVSKSYVHFLPREVFLRMMSGFMAMKSRGRLELLACLLKSEVALDGISFVGYLSAHLMGLLRDLIFKAAIPLTTLQILNKYAASLPVAVVEVLASNARDGSGVLAGLLSRQSSREIRHETYGLLMTMHKLKLANFNGLILKGLSDPDDAGMEADAGSAAAATSGIRRRVLDFLNESLPGRPVERMLYLMSELFRDADEEDWVGVTAYLMVVLTRETREYDAFVFDKDLGDCVFQSMALRQDLSAACHPSTPLFSFDKTQSLLPPSQAARLRRSQQGGVRGTQVYAWSQTQGLQRSQNVLSGDDSTRMGPPAFAPLSQSGKTVITQETVARGASSFRPRSEHTKAATQPSRAFRKYRDGELPDVKILGKDIVNPLSVLALMDRPAASVMLVKLFGDLFRSLFTAKQFDQTDALKACAQQILTRKSSSSYFAEASLGICLLIVRIDPRPAFAASTVCDLGMACMQHHAAILLIEEQLVMLNQRDGADAEKQTHLVSLSVLYGALNEAEILLGVASVVARADRVVLQGLDTELVGDFAAAARLYSQAIDEGGTENVQMWEGRLRNCLRELGEWEQLSDRVLLDAASGDGFDVVQAHEQNKSSAVSAYLECLVLSPSGTRSDELGRFIVSVFSGDRGREVRSWLEDKSCLHLALGLAIRGDWLSVLRLTKRCCARFLAQWQVLHPLAHRARVSLLNEVQCFAELEEAAERNLAGSAGSADEPSLAEKWSATYPSLDDPLALWSTVSAVRNTCYDKSQASAECMLRFYENSCYAALRRGTLANVKANLRHCADLRIEFGVLGGSAVRETEVVMLYNLHNIQKKARNPKLVGEIKKSLAQTQACIELKLRESSSAAEAAALQTMRAGWMRTAAQFGGPADALAALAAYRGVVCSGERESAVLYSEVADFTEELLSQQLQGFDAEELALSFADALTNGLVRGDARCRALLMRLMTVVRDHPRAAESLLARLSAIPAWTFLQNIAQLVSRLERPEGACAARLIEAVAHKYPFAVFYHLKIAGESANAGSAARVASIRKALNLPAADSFVEALSGLTHPEMRWSDAMGELDLLVSTGASKAALDDKFQSLRDCIELEWPGVGKSIGDYNKKFAKKFSRDVTSILDSGASHASMHQQLKALTSSKQMDEVGPRFGGGKVPLCEFSNWLAEFDPLICRLEVPGMYCFDVNREPTVGLHPMLVGCSPELLVMESKRKPKRITFVANDGREYPFLCKGGEDLRNDERVVSLLALMNAVASDSSQSRSYADAVASSESATLVVKVYAVVPMTVRVGLIEWVQNTLPLRLAIEQEMLRDSSFREGNASAISSENNKEAVSLDGLVAVPLSKWMPSHDSASYHAMYKTRKSALARKTFEEFLTKIPVDFLRRKLIRMSGSASEFLTMRTEYALSLAASSAFGYILGLGDRHLENILLDTKCGSLIHIDFGISFGMGASHLPVPELIPFRLTPQMKAVLLPLEDTGLLRQYLVKVMQKLQCAHGIKTISNALEICVDDPVVDWLKDAARRGESDSSAASWEPARRIAMAIRKLNGASPVSLLVEELSSNARVTKHGSLAALTQIVEACRCAGSEEPCDVGALVDELLQLATDPNILARQWIGLTAWI